MSCMHSMHMHPYIYTYVGAICITYLHKPVHACAHATYHLARYTLYITREIAMQPFTHLRYMHATCRSTCGAEAFHTHMRDAHHTYMHTCRLAAHTCTCRFNICKSIAYIHTCAMNQHMLKHAMHAYMYDDQHMPKHAMHAYIHAR
jgi:hypothetical protein